MAASLLRPAGLHASWCCWYLSKVSNKGEGFALLACMADVCVGVSPYCGKAPYAARLSLH